MSLGRKLPRILILVLLGFVLIVAGMDFIADRLIFFPERPYVEGPSRYGFPFENIELHTSDGVKLFAWWIGDSSLPRTVLYFHGNAGNISHRLHRLHVLKDLPARFFFLEYRGYGRSEGTPSEEGLYHDAEAAYRYLVETKSVPTSNVILFGESLGGAVAIELASRLPVGGVVLESTFTSIRDMAARYYPFLPSAIVPNQFDSLSKMGKIKAPILIVHGRKDEIVPFSMGERLFQAANAPKTFLPISDAGHNDVYLTADPDYARAIREYISRK